MCGPSRTATAPASWSAAVSASLMPPSGPTTTATTGRPPGSGRPAPPIDAVAASWRTSTAPPASVVSRTHRARARVERSSPTCGTRARRACLAASRAVACHRARPLAAFGPLHTGTHRSACQGTTVSTPTSVAVWTACSSRPPLARACTRVRRNGGGVSAMRSITRTARRSLCPASPAAAAASHTSRSPAPSTRSTRSPARSRRTVTAWRASGPVRVSVSPGRAASAPPAGSSVSGVRMKTGALT